MNSINIGNNEINLREITYVEYSKLREYRFSSDSLDFDDPNRPIPNEDKEKEWWSLNVVTKKHIVLAIENNKDLCGVVNAFSFDRKNKTCEVGIEIYPRSNYKKGIGKKAIRKEMKIQLCLKC